LKTAALKAVWEAQYFEFMADNNYQSQVVRLGIPDQIIEHGEQPELWADSGYDAKGIAAAVKSIGISRISI